GPCLDSRYHDRQDAALTRTAATSDPGRAEDGRCRGPSCTGDRRVSRSGRSDDQPRQCPQTDLRDTTEALRVNAGANRVGPVRVSSGHLDRELALLTSLSVQFTIAATPSVNCDGISSSFKGRLNPALFFGTFANASRPLSHIPAGSTGGFNTDSRGPLAPADALRCLKPAQFALGEPRRGPYLGYHSRGIFSFAPKRAPRGGE